MLHLKLTRALGRGIMNATPSDVKDVQTRLKAIKHLGQPLYKGKIDGKDGKKTIDAICAFQTREKLPNTGCIKPGDKTAQKLRDRTPMTVKLPLGITPQSSNHANRQKVAIKKTCNEICQRAELPEAEAKELAKAVERVGENGFPLRLVWVKPANQCDFEVEIDLIKEFADTFSELQQAVKDVKEVIKKTLKPGGLWQLVSGNGIKLRSKAFIPVTRESGVCSIPEIQAALRSVAHSEFSYDTGHPNFHSYCHATYLCRETQAGRCTANNAFVLLKKFPAPQLDGFRGAVDGGVSELTVGDVSHKIIESKLALVNYTLEGAHMFHPGSVLRMVVRHKGCLYIGTYGEGTGRWPYLNEEMAAQVWGGADRAIIAGMATLR